MKMNRLNGRDIKTLFFLGGQQYIVSELKRVYKGIVGLKALAYNA